MSRILVSERFDEFLYYRDIWKNVRHSACGVTVTARANSTLGSLKSFRFAWRAGGLEGTLSRLESQDNY
jgi:hypothetical protein